MNNIKKEEGSSATDSVTDVTDFSPMEEGRKKREEGRGKKGRIGELDN